MWLHSEGIYGNNYNRLNDRKLGKSKLKRNVIT